MSSYVVPIGGTQKGAGGAEVAGEAGGTGGGEASASQETGEQQTDRDEHIPPGLLVSRYTPRFNYTLAGAYERKGTASANTLAPDHCGGKMTESVVSERETVVERPWLQPTGVRV